MHSFVQELLYFHLLSFFLLPSILELYFRFILGIINVLKPFPPSKNVCLPVDNPLVLHSVGCVLNRDVKWVGFCGCVLNIRRLQSAAPQ